MAALAKLVPLFDRVLVRKLVPPAKSLGGVILPENLARVNSGIVVAAGEKQLESGSTLPLSVKEGDKVLLPEYGGKDVKLGDEEFILYREEELLAILHDDSVAE